MQGRFESRTSEFAVFSPWSRLASGLSLQQKDHEIPEFLHIVIRFVKPISTSTLSKRTRGPAAASLKARGTVAGKEIPCTLS